MGLIWNLTPGETYKQEHLHDLVWASQHHGTKKKVMKCLPNIDWISYHGDELRNGIFPAISINKGVTFIMVLALQMWISEPRVHPGRIIPAIWQLSNCCHSLRWVLRSLRVGGGGRCENTESVQFSSSFMCNPMDCSTPGFPVHHQLAELAQNLLAPVTEMHRKGMSSVSPDCYIMLYIEKPKCLNLRYLISLNEQQFFDIQTTWCLLQTSI